MIPVEHQQFWDPLCADFYCCLCRVSVASRLEESLGFECSLTEALCSVSVLCTTATQSECREPIPSLIKAVWEGSVCGLTQFSAHCVVHRGSGVVRRIPSSHPLTLANAHVLPVTCAIFKRTAHKTQTCFIYFFKKKKQLNLFNLHQTHLTFHFIKL